MKSVHYLIIGFAMCFLLSFLLGCENGSGESVDGDDVDGDLTDGDTPDGDDSDGDVPEGDAPDGDHTDEDLADSDPSDGDLIDGDVEMEVDSDKEPVDGDSIESEADGDVEFLEGEREWDGDGEWPDCVGPCNSEVEDPDYCPYLIDEALCVCHGDTGQWELVDCFSHCTGQGDLGSEGCGFDFENGGFECLCTQDCNDSTAVQDDCDNPAGPIYTNCTCASVDPCNWSDNYFCDQVMCSYFFPDDYFDDGEDCEGVYDGDLESVDGDIEGMDGDWDYTDWDWDWDGELPDCVGPCGPQVEDPDYCPYDNEGALCKCNTGTQEWELVDCTVHCTNLGASGSEGCNFGFDGYACICTENCADTSAVQADCEDPYGPIYTNCTCAASDPCGWADNEFCDQSICSFLYPNDYFDDFADCGEDCSNPTDVQAFCDGNTLNNCTCTVSDPCGWSGDGACNDLCAILYPADHFVDVDCR